MSETARFICGGSDPEHVHNDDWVSIETFDHEYLKGPRDEVEAFVKEKKLRVQMESVCCSCGSSAFGRDVYCGLE